MRTFGEFFDAVSTWVETNNAFEASTLLDEWRDLAEPEVWERARIDELSWELVLNFAEDMTKMSRAGLRGVCTSPRYSETIKSGHKFLQAIARIAQEHGMEVDIERFDVPLTLFDGLLMGQRAREARP